MNPFGAAMAIGLFTLTGCGSLLPPPPPQPAYYTLDASAATPPPLIATAQGGHTLVINPPRAAAGFDSAHIIYLRQAQQHEYFAHSLWVDTPTRMLAPLIASAMAQSPRFSAVVLAPTAARGELRLDTELLRLHQDFRTTPSRVRFTLRATLLDSAQGRVIAWREFDEIVTTTSDDPYGGVLAAQIAVAQGLVHLREFCEMTLGGWKPRDNAPPT